MLGPKISNFALLIWNCSRSNGNSNSIFSLKMETLPSLLAVERLSVFIFWIMKLRPDRTLMSLAGWLFTVLAFIAVT